MRATEPWGFKRGVLPFITIMAAIFSAPAVAIEYSVVAPAANASVVSRAVGIFSLGTPSISAPLSEDWERNLTAFIKSPALDWEAAQAIFPQVDGTVRVQDFVKALGPAAQFLDSVGVVPRDLVAMGKASRFYDALAFEKGVLKVWEKKLMEAADSEPKSVDDLRITEEGLSALRRTYWVLQGKKTRRTLEKVSLRLARMIRGLEAKSLLNDGAPNPAEAVSDAVVADLPQGAQGTGKVVMGLAPASESDKLVDNSRRPPKEWSFMRVRDEEIINNGYPFQRQPLDKFSQHLDVDDIVNNLFAVSNAENVWFFMHELFRYAMHSKHDGVRQRAMVNIRNRANKSVEYVSLAAGYLERLAIASNGRVKVYAANLLRETMKVAAGEASKSWAIYGRKALDNIVRSEEEPKPRTQGNALGEADKTAEF